ncbi:copper homeostasis protein CutC [Moritella sp. Urea-trap-13]|uniref:copper homeostasis protein CutC n=1 Tax=Moritella sp. Urea-trap-13 TaxID=2058327 RepID=UPI000C341838|nr:copper homeostasis protein CutC [Moritella sp. Urea-trap-13]PKH06517.1 copper homeostasis protein CutC [Moritella sp. Urea-trap-13]
MTITIEVCVDNIESLLTAQQAGADRIELCSALPLGGLTANAGFVQKALDLATVPLYAIIRPRAGDFIYSEQEIDIMVSDIKFMTLLGIQGVVIGALTPEGDIDKAALKRLMTASRDIGVTFHRAFDLCNDPQTALEILIDAGCERVLTSGQQATAEQGCDLITALVAQAGDRISIMPGAGVNPENAKKIIKLTRVSELHLSGKTTRKSTMKPNATVQMGTEAEADSLIAITCKKTISDLVNLVNG